MSLRLRLVFRIAAAVVVVCGTVGIVPWLAERPQGPPVLPPEREAWLRVEDGIRWTRDHRLPSAIESLASTRDLLGTSDLVDLYLDRARSLLGIRGSRPGGPPPRVLSEWLENAWALLEDGDADAALVEIERFLSWAPASPGARFLEAKAHAFVGDPEAALRGAEKILAAAPGNAEALFLLASSARDLGDLGSAVRAYTRIREIAPFHLAAANQLLQVRFGLGEIDESLEEDVQRLSRLHDRIRFYRGRVPLEEDSLDGLVDAHLSAAASYRDAGDFPLAVVHYEIARALEPRHLDAAYHLAELYPVLGLPSAAEAAGARLASLSSAATAVLHGSSALAPAELGERLLDLGIATGAARAFELALAEADGTAEALLVAQGRAYLATGRAAEAQTCAERVLDRDPAHGSALVLLAESALRRKDYERAIEVSGVASGLERVRLVATVRSGSPDASRAFWEWAGARTGFAPLVVLGAPSVGPALVVILALVYIALVRRSHRKGVWIDAGIFLVSWWVVAGWFLLDLPEEIRLTAFRGAIPGLLCMVLVPTLAFRAIRSKVGKGAGATVILVAWIGCAPAPERPVAAAGEQAPPPETQDVPPGDTGAFRETTDEAGIRFIHVTGATGQFFPPETMGSGACFLDHDDDGDIDLYLVQGGNLPGADIDPPPGNVLYRNEGDGTFEDVTGTAGVGDTGYGMGCSAADFDNDGDADLYVTNFGANRLYRNEGDGTFEEIGSEAGVDDARWGASSAWLDFDGDGRLDLYVTNYLDFRTSKNLRCGLPGRAGTRSYCHPDAYDGQADVLYRNRGDGTFEDVTRAAGVLTTEGKGLGVVASDADADGDPDLYVANDSVRNFLYRNRGDGTFEEIGILAGVAYDANGRSQAGMGVDAADFDRDGDFDFFVTNFRMEYNALYRNYGNGRFADATLASGLGWVSLKSLAFGTHFLDYDGDGWPDLYVANGDIIPQVHELDPTFRYAQPDQLLRNEGGRFVEVPPDAAGAWFRRETVSRGSAIGDYDDDGDLDVVVVSSGSRAVLLRNHAGDLRSRIRIALDTGGANRDAIGAKVTVEAEGVPTQMSEVRAGSSYCSQSDLRLVFGLGDASSATVTVAWPGGGEERVSDLPANVAYRIVKGAGVVERNDLNR